MIFVSVGTHETPFDRLLRAVETLPQGEPLVVQHGPSSLRPSGAVCVDYLAFEELVRYVRSARVVLTHAGVGSVMVALTNGKRPIVVPRLHRFGEHVDDHQLELGRRLEAAGLVTLVEDPEQLPIAVSADERPADEVELGRWLGDDLLEYLSARIQPRAGALAQAR